MPPKAKEHGVAPRPRVALVGLAPNEERTLARYFPTVHRVQTVLELPEVASPAELDLIVSAGDTPTVGHQKRESVKEYERRHLILFGPNPWLHGESPGPTGEAAHRYLCERTSRSTEFKSAMDLDQRLSRALEASLPVSALGLNVIELVRVGMATVRTNDPRPDGWLAWALDPPLPFALNVMRRGFNAGLAWFLYPTKLRVDLVKAVCAVWAPFDRESFPSIVDWAETREWMTKEEQTLRDQQTALTAAFEDAQKQFREKSEQLRLQAQAAKDRADSGPRSILMTNDESLVRAVRIVFEDLGFDVESVDEEREENAPKREDLQLRRPSEDRDWVAIVEVKGHKKRGAAAEDLTKIERHVCTFLKDEGREPSVKMYVCNSQFGLSPDEREIPYASHPAQVEDFCKDPTVPGIIVPTPDLFSLHRDREELGVVRARQLLLSTCGVFRYRPTKD